MEKKQNKNSDRKIQQNNAWTNAHFDRVNLAMPKGQKARVQAAAKAAGLSTNAYAVQAIFAQVERDEKKGAAKASPDDSGQYSLL